jgi:hypothetical protein
MRSAFSLTILAALLVTAFHGVEGSNEADSEALQFVKQFIAENPIAMFSKSYCP